MEECSTWEDTNKDKKSFTFSGKNKGFHHSLAIILNRPGSLLMYRIYYAMTLVTQKRSINKKAGTLAVLAFSLIMPMIHIVYCHYMFAFSINLWDQWLPGYRTETGNSERETKQYFGNVGEWRVSWGWCWFPSCIYVKTYPTADFNMYISMYTNYFSTKILEIHIISSVHTMGRKNLRN